MKSVALFLANGFEEVEALTTVDLLRRAGIKVDTISVSGDKQVTGRTDITVTADEITMPNVENNYDGIIFPGGMPGTTNLMESKAVCDLVREFSNKGKLVAAICAAPTLLGKLGVLENKNACCYPGFEKELTGAKANELKVNVDGSIITSRGIGTAIDFSLSIIEYLTDKEKANEISKDIVYNI